MLGVTGPRVGAATGPRLGAGRAMEGAGRLGAGREMEGAGRLGAGREMEGAGRLGAGRALGPGCPPPLGPGCATANVDVSRNAANVSNDILMVNEFFICFS